MERHPKVADTGDDRLTGGTGDDCYLFHGGFGSDVIEDDAGEIRLLFANAYEHHLTFTRHAEDLVIDVATTGDRVTLRSYYRNRASLVSIVLYAGRLEGQALRDRLP